MEQAKGIEPSQPAWEAGVLPLNYACACWNFQQLNPIEFHYNMIGWRKQENLAEGLPAETIFFVQNTQAIQQQVLIDNDVSLTGGSD